MSNGDKEKALTLILRYGWNATAFQTLEDGYSYFFTGDDSCVAYLDTGGAWVVAGAPIAPPERLRAVTALFIEAAKLAKKRVCFFATEERLLQEAPFLTSLQIGEQPHWDPAEWPVILQQHKSLREQLRRARAKKVEIREATQEELEGGPIREAMLRLVERWLAGRDMAPMGFLVHIDLFTFSAHRRCFIAEQEGRLVGFAGVVPVPARGGWFIEDLLRDPEAPNGTNELLVDAVMTWAAESGSQWLTLGMVPLSGELNRPLHYVKKSTSFLYDFEGLKSYKAKLRPHRWSAVYLAHPSSQGALQSTIDALAAFTRGGFLGFGLRSLLRGPSAILRILALLLIPWTLLVLLSPAMYWFHSAWSKWVWVSFDIFMLLGMFSLLRRWRHSIATLLAIAATSGAMLTLLQSLLWVIPHAHEGFDYLVIGISCLGPLLASLVLWGGRHNRNKANTLHS